MQKDKYPSLVSLRKHLRNNEDYRVRTCDRQSVVTIFSPHGGHIEPGTSAIAAAVAGVDFNLYDFQGLRLKDAMDLHVTATRFRDRPLNAMLKVSRLAVSIHGMGYQGHSDIWLGGLNLRLKQLVLDKLEEHGFTVNPDSPLYRGESPLNAVNLTAEHGVQLELPYELLEALFVHSRFLKYRRVRTNTRFDSLVTAVRSAIEQYLHT